MEPSSEGQKSKSTRRRGAGLQTGPKKNKLPRLPKNTKITKRPLLHPSIASPYNSASSEKVIYVSPSTPFISAVKRVRALLAQIEKREKPTKGLTPNNVNAAQARAVNKGAKSEEVFLKGTGKAIEKVLSLGLFFQGQKDCRVRVGTRSVGAVDDIEAADEDGDEEDVDDSRVRRVSVVEVAVGLR